MSLFRRLTTFGAIGALTSLISPASDLDEYRALSDRIYFRGAPGQTLEGMLWSQPARYKETTEALAALVTTTALRAAAASTASSDSVERAIQELQGHLTPESTDAAYTVPFAALARTNGFQTLFLAFSVMRGGGGIPENASFLQFFSAQSGSWKLVADEGKEFDGCFFSATRMGSLPSGEDRYVVWGKAFGDTGSRLKIRVYGFDGTAEKVLYSRNGLVRGLASLAGDQITLSYQAAVGSVFVKPHRVREVFVADAAGLRQVSTEMEQ